MRNRFHIQQFLHLTLAHLKEVTRQPAILFWGIIFPILLSIGLGMAFTRAAETEHHIGFTNADESGSAPRAPDVIEALFSSSMRDPDHTLGILDETSFMLTVRDDMLGDTLYIFDAGSWDESILRLKQGRIHLIMEITDAGDVMYHFDPQNQDARLAWHALRTLVGVDAPPTDGEFKTPATIPDTGARVSPLEIPGTRYIDFLVPGLISMTVMMSCMWGISYGMIDKRSKKLLRRMVATPMVKSHFLAALMLVRIFINIVESALLVFFAWMIFDIAIQGSAGALVMVFMAGNIAFCGIAVFVSSRTANTEVGNGMINAVVMPMTLLSGVFFSYHNFPEWSIPVIGKLPLALLVDGIRAIFTEGAGLAETAPAAILLFLTGAVFFTAGLKIFKWH
ncbi:MAG: ABC transporter permease [Desulfosalsimonadaceae bacterium]